MQVCENNWIRRIKGVKRVKRADKRRMDELRVEESFENKLMRSSVKWAHEKNGR